MGTIARSTWTDDDGSGTTGSIINAAELAKIYDNIDSEVKSATNPAVTTKAAVDSIVGSTAGFLYTSNGAGLGSFASPAMKRLRANSGNSTAAGATTLDSLALSGLTSKDILRIIIATRSIGGVGVTGNLLYHVTDAFQIAALADANNNYYLNVYDLVNPPNDATHIAALGNNFGTLNATRNATATAWTSPWTIGLRHGGVPAGDTFYWEWAIYQMLGQ